MRGSWLYIFKKNGKKSQLLSTEFSCSRSVKTKSALSPHQRYILYTQMAADFERDKRVILDKYISAVDRWMLCAQTRSL